MHLEAIPWDSQATWPILGVLQLLPLLGALVVLALRRGALATYAGVTLVSIELLLAIFLYRGYEPSRAVLQFAEHWYLPGLLDYHAAVDGISILFILLTALIILLVALYGPVRGLGPPWRLMALILVIESSLMLMFTTLNLLWFVFATAIQTGLIGLLLKLWATSSRIDRAINIYIKFMGIGLVLLLSGTLILGWGHTHVTEGGWTFDLLELQRAGVGREFQTLVFYLLFYGFAIRSPLFPMHGWLPQVAEHGNIAVAPTLLLGLKVGIFGLLRFVLPLLPEAVQYWQPFVVAFAVVGIFYSALLAMVQEDLRRLLAFAVVSHTGLIVLGLFTLDHQAFQGSVMLAVTFGLAIAALLFMTGLVYRRTKTTHLTELGGLFDQVPFIGFAFLVAGLSIIGMPGTPGFDAAHLVLEAAMARFGGLLTIAAALGNLLAAGFLLWAFQRAFLGPRPEGHAQVEHLSLAEWLVSGAVIAVLLGVGFYSHPWLALIDEPLAALSIHYAQP